MAKFYPLTVSDVRKETSECVSIGFDIPDEYRPHFEFTQGQHLTLKKTIEGEDVRRSYSVCTSPLENEVRVAIKKVNGGQFSTFANEKMQAGDSIEVMPATGHFNCPLEPLNNKSYLAIAAGSGITPIISIIKTTLATEPLSHFTLLYGNRRTETIVFQEELEAIKNKYLSRFVIHHFFSEEKVDSELFKGRISSEKIHQLKGIIDYPSIDEVFICGPEEMMAETSETFKEIGINKEHIHLELFTSPVGKLGKQVSTKDRSSEIVNSAVTIILDGVQIDFPVNSETSILDLANEKGADLPFSCKGGVCSTCKAKLLEGKVNMETNYALEPDEIEAGYILTCQSHPASKKVLISFDEG